MDYKQIIDLQPIHLCAEKTVSDIELKHFEFEVLADNIYKQLVFKLQTKLLGKYHKPVTKTTFMAFDFPSSWWQHTKKSAGLIVKNKTAWLDCVPLLNKLRNLFLKLFKYKTITYKPTYKIKYRLCEIYPDLTQAIPNNQYRAAFLMDRNDSFEVDKEIMNVEV